MTSEFVSFSILSRRSLLQAAAGICLASSSSALANVERTAQRVVSLDYGLVSTMLAFGVAPVAIAGRADWSKWVVEPELPSGIADLGSTSAINFEVLASIKPTLILTTPFLAPLKPKLEAISPVLELTIYAEGGDALSRSIAATEALGVALGREAQARDFLEKADRQFDEYAARIAHLNAPSLALVNFVDLRHARIYGGGGLYQSVLSRIVLRNAWTGSANYWGFETIGLEQLALMDQNLRLVAFEPLTPPDIMERLEESPLWSSLPFVEAGRYTILPGVLMFGMVVEALRFADLLVDALERTA
ncbi:iron-siderophore ABC transporter substrate-binding protein [Ochrobactrum sp. 19YEA23]|uniref:iron-siderophore ABC transporter substrate-binding protein n=1 Tax=Ochrobactrum sp. 19YEA23 TaxID=3039854 RepID=UPI0037094626